MIFCSIFNQIDFKLTESRLLKPFTYSSDSLKKVPNKTSKKNFSFKFGLTCENGNDKQDYEVILEIAESDNPGTSEENHHPPIIDISGFNAQEGTNFRIIKIL